MKPSITSSTSARYVELSLGAQTAYAQLLEAALAAEHHRSVADLKGSFAKKTVKGATYWYYQYTEPSGVLRQVYVGPEGPAVAALRERKSTPGTFARLRPMARAAAALGCAEMLGGHARVIHRLSEYGFFRAGGVLIGTHAFLAFGNMLGVRWTASDRTQDVDFAHAGKSLSIALPTNVELNADAAIKSLGMGFLPIQGMTGQAGATYLNPRSPEFRLDFVTTRHRGGERPFSHPKLGVSLQPLPFMEYSLEDVQQAALFSGDTVIVANVPHPARYALHKLIVMGERQGAYAGKASKDLEQAGALLARLQATRTADIEHAWHDLVSRGPEWRRRAKRGLETLARRFPDLKLDLRTRG
jgi:hypothetical protein